MKKVLTVVLMALVALTGCATNGTVNNPGADASDNQPSARSQPPLFPERSSHDRAGCARANMKVGTVIRGQVMVAEGFPPPGGEQVASNVAGILFGALVGVGFVRYRTCKNPAVPVEATIRSLATFSPEEIKVLNQRRASNGEPPVDAVN